MQDVTRDLVISAPIGRVWAALTDPKTIGAWMGDDDVQSDLRPGGAYVLFGGETTGSYEVVEAPTRLTCSWRQSTWQPGWPDSQITWELESVGEDTRLRLRHGGFPNPEERESHDEGWDVYFLEPMKEWLEESR